ncbi:LolA family protein [Marixanthomonas spongiae]|uniref:Cell envelope biogenesis protein LolA n=1 Tax=Marixanthomonas spongiae TaxID=2174845 RepID=A0A2U0HZR0_9FLAO|nr:outer membrane lipoprotein carrier protein LolA [Marixanthomonas spongiae]PVW14318.1 cell envelope biogenesis protein LolA [Marixanthomonas spongiae]
MRSFIIILFSLFVQHLFAQTPLTSTEIDQFKQHVKQTAQQTKTIVSDFVQEKQMEFLNDGAISEGTLTFKSPDAIRWEYTKPYTYEVIFKGDQLLVNDGNGTQHIDLSSDKLFKSFNTLLVNSIKGDMFQDEDFKISYFKAEDGFQVRFIPKEKRMKRFIASLQLSFSEEDYQVTQLKLIEPSEDFTLITFKNKQINVSVPDSVFKL